MDTGCDVTVFDWLIPLLASPFAGSLIGVLIERLPAGRPVAMARSRCDSCDRPLGAADLAPLLSFLILRGRCRSCGARIPRFHLAIELAATAVAAWAAIAETSGSCGDIGLRTAIWIDCGLGWTLLALAWIDYRWMRLPDALTLPLLVAGLAVAFATDREDLADHAAAAITGYAAFRLISIGYRKWRGREGLGGGDAKLLAAGGAWLGLTALPYVVLAAAFLGIVSVGFMAARGAKVAAATAIPFGPCLAMAIWLVWLYFADVWR